MAQKANSGKKRGPKPNHLKFDDNWENGVKKAIQKKKPKGGWPKKAKKGRKSD